LALDTPELICLIAGVQNTASLKIWNDYIAKNNVEEGGWIRPCIRDYQWPSKFEVREKFQKLIEECWDENPLNRPSIKQCEIALNQIDPQQPSEPMERLVTTLEIYSTNLENVVHSRHKQLQDEVQKTDDLFSHLPKSVIECMRQGKMIETEQFHDVTIYYSNLIGFSNIITASSPLEAVTFLSDIYEIFDTISAKYDVFKIETIGCAFMFASGLTNGGGQHAGEVCTVALQLMNSLCSFEIAHVKNLKLNLQVGIHTGNAVSLVVGLKMPRYRLFGDSVDVAVKMEYTGMPGLIHISEDTFLALESIGGYICEYRYEITDISGSMKSYWLKGENQFDNEVAKE